MSFLPLTDALRADYLNLFNTCQVSPERQKLVDIIVDRIVANKSRYEAVGVPLPVPWYVVGTIHNLEASLNFATHLHNGDPLTARTVHQPPGRPITGSPTFTWEESATDALSSKGLNRVTTWTTADTLYRLEGYNGFGYRTNHPEVRSPYLWSMSNQYTMGKFTKDGLFDPQAVSSQVGGAVVLRRMAERGVIEFAQSGEPITGIGPDASIQAFAPLVTYAPTVFSENAKTLQIALNRFPGIFVLTDGFAGDKTSDAFMKLTGHFLSGDPRAVLAAAAATAKS